MPGWKDIVAGRTGHKSYAALQQQVRDAEAALKAADHTVIEDSIRTSQSQRLRAWSANREGLSPNSAADLDRMRAREMWAIREGISVEGSPVGMAGEESMAAAEQALAEQLGFEVNLRNMPKPGTQEFMERYCQPPEPIERIVPDGAEGFGVVKCDVEGNPLTEGVEPLKLEGPGPSRGTTAYSAYDHSKG